MSEYRCIFVMIYTPSSPYSSKSRWGLVSPLQYVLML